MIFGNNPIFIFWRPVIIEAYYYGRPVSLLFQTLLLFLVTDEKSLLLNIWQYNPLCFLRVILTCGNKKSGQRMENISNEKEDDDEKDDFSLQVGNALLTPLSQGELFKQ